MFQPQATPYTPSFFPYGINEIDLPLANAEIPHYDFQATPLGQFSGVHGDGAGTSNHQGPPGPGARAGLATAADLYVSPIFQQQPQPHQHQHQHQQPPHHNHIHNHNQNQNQNQNSHQHLQHRQQPQQSQQKQQVQQLRHLPYNLAPHHLHHHEKRTNIRSHHHHHHRRPLKMEQSSQQTDLAQQEAAARDYKPQLEGAMVGEKMPSHVITEEYAQADPIYVAKTMALPQTFSHYRPIQGDGNCGWRAIVFAYFEALLKLQDMQKIEDEKIRLTNLNDLNNVLTEDELEMIEPFRDEVAELFNQVLAAVSAGQDPVCLLMDKFNDINTSPAILYYFRLLTASELQRFPERYVGFIPDGVSCFIDTVVKVVDKEIEHMCIEPLCDLLLREKGIGIGLEIAYLDRSEGSEVNRHLFPGSTNGQDPMYLLYRPGHYDILYRDNVYRPPQPVPTDPVSLQIHRVTSFTHHHEIQSVGPTLQNFATMDMSTLTMIPPFEAPGLSPLASPLAGSSPMTDPYAPSPQSPWIPQQFPETTPQQALPPARQQPSPPQQQPAASTTIHQLRFSKYNFPNLPEMAESNTTYEPAFQTNTFKNSHFNVAHYNNMNFQPEMYKPDAEDEIPSSASSGRGGGRKRSSEH